MDGCVNVSVADEPALKRCQAFSALQVHVCNLHCIHTHTHRQHAARHGRLCQRERGGRARAQEVPGVQRAADNTLHVMDGCVNVSVADEPALKRCQAFSALQVHVCNLHCIHTHRQHAARHGRLCQRERGGRARAQEVPGVQRAADNTLHVMDGCVNVSVADEPALKRCQAFSALQVHVCNLHCIHTHRQHAARHGRLCQRERGGRARAQEVPGVQRAADNTLHVMDGCVNVSVADEPALKRCQAFSALQEARSTEDLYIDDEMSTNVQDFGKVKLIPLHGSIHEILCDKDDCCLVKLKQENGCDTIYFRCDDTGDEVDGTAISGDLVYKRSISIEERVHRRPRPRSELLLRAVSNNMRPRSNSSPCVFKDTEHKEHTLNIDSVAPYDDSSSDEFENMERRIEEELARNRLGKISEEDLAAISEHTDHTSDGN
ncbi:unnamed protein product [Danaus chrysippus]|uniref:(African queen) hypothetical protein n=1 Tax=Danaus chrysippus TaxID=151541 RepID=A0A8J2QN01_9NEOP|nr:unnamed protein product [Danaus chrysippus]